MSLITVDEEKCIKCAMCVKECPVNVLSFDERGPKEIAPERCIACGHCVAVCPKEAIENERTPLANQIELEGVKKLSSKEAETFLRSRRSIRSYKETSVPREELVKLVNIARLAPTGHNSQGISFVIVDDKKAIEEAVEITIKCLENDQNSDVYSSFIKNYREEGIDSILRGAPSLVLTTAPTEFRNGRENSIFYLTYLELFAPTLGLGSCWAGLLERCALSNNSPIIDLFNIPKGHKITGAVMVGYPKYSYKRLIDKNPLNVTFYEN